MLLFSHPLSTYLPTYLLRSWLLWELPGQVQWDGICSLCAEELNSSLHQHEMPALCCVAAQMGVQDLCPSTAPWL